MTETKATDSPSRQEAGHSTKCFFCGRKESGEWHYSAALGSVVCDDCYRRAMTPPPKIPAAKQA